jgi:GGDEF domain-containing protein
MRDAQHDVDLTDGPWPAAVIEGLPVGLLEVDARGRAVRANAEVVRLLAVAAGDADRRPPAQPTVSRLDTVDGPRVADRWPQLAEATIAVLSGRSIDCVVTTPGAVLRVRGVPRWSGPPPHGGLLVVSDASTDGPAVVDLRDPVASQAAAAVTTAAVTAAGAEPARRPGPGWLRPSLPGSRRRHPAARSDEHAATHDPLTGLPNQVLLLQCLAEALATCRPGRRVGVLTVEVGAAGGSGTVDVETLRGVATRLSQLARPQDVVARLEGLRFAVLLREVRPGSDVEEFGTRLAERLLEPAAGSYGTGREAGTGLPGAAMLDGPGLVLANPASGSDGDRNPRWVLALALEALERSRVAGRPVVAPELPTQAERARVAALWAYDVHDSALDDVLHGITQVAVSACDAYAALLTFVDSDLQWIRAATGVEVSGLADGHGPRHLALCDRTIRGREVLEIPDTQRDAGFRSSRHVGWQMGMRFYAGAPLLTPEGRAIGTLCVFDTFPKNLTPRQRQTLTVLAAETVALLEAHRVQA